MSFCPGEYVRDGESMEYPSLSGVYTPLSSGVDFSDSIASGVEGFGADFFLRTAEEIFITLVPHGRVERPHGVDTL